MIIFAILMKPNI